MWPLIMTGFGQISAEVPISRSLIFRVASIVTLKYWEVFWWISIFGGPIVTPNIDWFLVQFQLRRLKSDPLKMTLVVIKGVLQLNFWRSQYHIYTRGWGLSMISTVCITSFGGSIYERKTVNPNLPFKFQL